MLRKNKSASEPPQPTGTGKNRLLQQRGDGTPTSRLAEWLDLCRVVIWHPSFLIRPAHRHMLAGIAVRLLTHKGQTP